MKIFHRFEKKYENMYEDDKELDFLPCTTLKLNAYNEINVLYSRKLNYF